MGLRRRTGVVAVLLALLGVACMPGPSWGQADQRIGTVLAVEGTAEVRAANTTTWEPLQFRAVLFPNDTVRTAANSKVKVLLRDESIMTLGERSEMQFTEFLLTPQQRRTIVNLALGRLRVVTTRIFGAGSTTEIRTANTVAGVRGTTFVVIFVPPEDTEVVALDGAVEVQNPRFPQLEPVPANFRTQVIGDAPPSRAVELPAIERQQIELGLRLTEQIPLEVQPTSERQAAVPIRGEPVIAGLIAPPLPSVAVLSPGVQLGALDATAQLNQLLDRTNIVNTAQASQPANTQQQIITPDNAQTINAIQTQQPPNLRITVTFPR
jgi:FecR-like protein